MTERVYIDMLRWCHISLAYEATLIKGLAGGQLFSCKGSCILTCLKGGGLTLIYAQPLPSSGKQDKHAAASISTYGEAHRSINPLAGMEHTSAVKKLILWMYK